MKLPSLTTRVLPTLTRAQECPACGQPFACEISLNGCWCSEVKLSPETLQELRSKYKGCLCRSCLESAEVTERIHREKLPPDQRSSDKLDEPEHTIRQQPSP